MIESMFTKQYSKSYNCVNFADDVMRSMGFAGLGNALGAFQGVCPTGRMPTEKARLLEALTTPLSPCLALFQARGDAHVGVYLEGKILHLTESGVCWMDLDDMALSFPRVRYYRCK